MVETLAQMEAEFWNAHETIRAKNDSISFDAGSIPSGAVTKFEAYKPRIVSREKVRIIVA